ncbi:MAG: carboxypeptidase-like regulatory domain-containing protein [Terracidiphilus sp.]
MQTMQKKFTRAIAGSTAAIVGCLLLCAGSLCALGQETRASLGGEVTDTRGAVVQKATVVVTADATGVAQTTTTNDAGDWRIEFLLPGIYHFEVTARGFESEMYSNIELQVNDAKTFDTQLRAGSQTESVIVTATTPLIDTTAAVSGTVITSNEMMELPSLSNAPTMLVGLTPGASTGSGNSGGVYLWSNIGLSETEINGTGALIGPTTTTYSAVGYRLDGGYDGDNAGQMAFSPPLDAVGEFKVVTNAYDASIGHGSGGVITLISKTGSKNFHGDAYEYNQNNFLNANSYQYDAQTPVTSMAPIHTNNYGATLGGPVWIPKFFGFQNKWTSYDGRKEGTFFFLSYSGIRNLAPVNPGFATVPSQAERNGDFSGSYTVSAGKTYPIDIYDPNTVVATSGGNFKRTEFGAGCTNTYPEPSTCNVIPSGRLDPVATAIMKLLPLPDAPAETTISNDANNYVKTEEQNDKFETYMLRLDHAWNNNNHTFVNLRQNHWEELSLDPFGASFYLNGYLQTRINKGVTIDHSVVLSNSFVLDLNYNVNRYFPQTKSSSAGISPTVLSSAYSANYIGEMQRASVPLYESIVTGAEKSGLGTDEAGNNTPDTIQDLNGSMTETYRNHSFRYGAEYMIQQEATGDLTTSGGMFSFGTNWTNSTPVGTTPTGSGSALASFMLGLPTGGSIPTTASGFWSQHFIEYYFQDDWRVNKKLTLNVGLRWDYEQPVTDRFNRFAYRFDPNFVVTGVTTAAQANYATLLAGSSASNTGLALLNAQRPSVSSFVAKGGLLYAGLNGTSRYVENPIKKYFQPRLGFAYKVFDNTVVRGGFGRFVQGDFTNGTGGAGGQTGYSQTTNFTPTTNNYESAPAISMENPYPNGLVPLTGNSQGELTNIGTVGAYTDPNIGRVYVDEASASVQQQLKGFLFEVGFTLEKTHGLSMAWEVNDPSAATWHAAYDPQFNPSTATVAPGGPVLTESGTTLVANPFYNVAGLATTISDYTSKTVAAYNLLRPNPVLGNLTENKGTGQNTYYAMNTKVEKRFQNGWSVLQSFSWSKEEAANSFIGPQVAQAVIWRQLSGTDQRFHYVLTPIYELPFGRGKRLLNHFNRLTDDVIGGWAFDGIYQFQSGTPLNLPTNSAFYEGGSPSLGSKKTSAQWFDTTRFEPYPTSSTTVAQLAAYPAWTGVQSLPGYGWVPTPSAAGYSKIANGVYNDFTTRVTYNQQYFGDIRNPYTTTFTLGARKSFAVVERIRFELGFDAFNALNHPAFGNIDVTPTDTAFGAISGSTNSAKWTQVNSPRVIQLRGRLTF